MKVTLYKEMFLLVECPHCGGFGYSAKLKSSIQYDEDGDEVEHWAEYQDPCRFCQTLGTIHNSHMIWWKKL